MLALCDLQNSPLSKGPFCELGARVNMDAVSKNILGDILKDKSIASTSKDIVSTLGNYHTIEMLY